MPGCAFCAKGVVAGCFGCMANTVLTILIGLWVAGKVILYCLYGNDTNELEKTDPLAAATAAFKVYWNQNISCEKSGASSCGEKCAEKCASTEGKCAVKPDECASGEKVPNKKED